MEASPFKVYFEIRVYLRGEGLPWDAGIFWARYPI